MLILGYRVSIPGGVSKTGKRETFEESQRRVSIPGGVSKTYIANAGDYDSVGFNPRRGI